MTSNELTAILRGCNCELFASLFPECAEKEHLEASILSETLPHSIDGRPGKSHLQDLNPVLSRLRAVGRLKKKDPFEDHLNELINLGSAGSPSFNAVGHFADSKTSNEPKSLGAILTVGINYSQGPSYVKHKVPLWGVTNMRRRLNASLSYFQQRHNVKALEDYHLVGTNLFPLITARGWSYLNSLEEVLLLKKFGLRRPLDVLDDLLGQLASDLKVVVFHGANNFVSRFGLEFIRNYSRPTSFPKMIFVDNLVSPSASNDIMIYDIQSRCVLEAVCVHRWARDGGSFPYQRRTIGRQLQPSLP